MGDSFLGAEMRGGRDGTLYGFGRSLLQPLTPQKRISSELAARDNEMVWNKSERRGRERDCITFFLGGTRPKLSGNSECASRQPILQRRRRLRARHKRISDVPARKNNGICTIFPSFSGIPWHQKVPSLLIPPYPPRSVGHSMPFLSSSSSLELSVSAPGAMHRSRLMMGEWAATQRGRNHEICWLGQRGYHSLLVPNYKEKGRRAVSPSIFGLSKTYLSLSLPPSLRALTQPQT